MKSYTFYNCPVQFLALALLVLLGLTAMANAQLPDPDYYLAESANHNPVSILVRPDGGGWALNNAMLFGGARTDATITLTILDETLKPVFNFPAESSWLESGCPDLPCLSLCETGSISDGNTNMLGQTTFSNPLRAGGSGDGATIMIGTWPTPEFPAEFSDGNLFHFNSPDINGDLVVNLIDVALFAGDYYGPYDYRSDFYWDGIVNLLDISLIAQAVGSSCP